MDNEAHRVSADNPTTSAYLKAIGVPELPARTSPFDPGYDPVTLEAHIAQSAHLISILKISMATWIVADEAASRRKFDAARQAGVKTTTGGGPFEVAVAQGQLPAYLELVASMGSDRIECGRGFTPMEESPADILRLASEYGLEVQYELGSKHGGGFDERTVAALVDEGKRWLDAGAVQLVLEARESAADVGLFDREGSLQTVLADRFAAEFGHELVTFEAPTKASQFALLSHFGPEVQLCNVRLEELLRVEIYRRGLHSDAFQHANLRPGQQS